MKTIVFLSGFAVPKILAKSKFVWDDKIWEDYNRVYYTSKTPTSDRMVEEELDNLAKLASKYPGAYFAGHSLGAWWLANLASMPNVDISKIVFMTPLVNMNNFPIFNVTESFNPLLRDKRIWGFDKVCVLLAHRDIIVNPDFHGNFLVNYLQANPYIMYGGHFYQSNHKAALEFVKVWLEL